MADRRRAVPENVPGDWFVDATCIDCGICRWVAPDTFGDAEDTAYVFAQPGDVESAARAAVACPVGSIGGPSEHVRVATKSFPYPMLPDVSFCGWANRESYGAMAWLIQRPGGNVLVDVPRATPVLMDRVAAMGGVRWMVLTHRDDVAGHEKWAERFGAERVLHRLEIGHDTRGVEHPVDGPMRLDDDLEIIALPGHTRGSMGLLWRDVLFSGDHVWGAGPRGWHAEGADPAGAHPLGAGRSVCWWSWPEQIRSMESLLERSFAHVLPGHGRPWHGGLAAREPALRALIAQMRR